MTNTFEGLSQEFLPNNLLFWPHTDRVMRYIGSVITLACHRLPFHAVVLPHLNNHKTLHQVTIIRAEHLQTLYLPTHKSRKPCTHIQGNALRVGGTNIPITFLLGESVADLS